MTEVEQLQQQLNTLHRRMTMICSVFAVLLVAVLLTATMGMAGGSNNQVGNSVIASRIAIVDNAGREVLTLGTTTDGTAGMWLKRGNSTNALMIQQADNTANIWARNYKLESSATREVGLLGISTEGRAGMWLMNGSKSNNILLQTPDNNVKLWAHDYYVKDKGRTLISMGTGTNGTGGVWLFNGNASKWALAVSP